MTRPVLALACILILAAVPAHAQTYAEGQVWEYRTRPGEEGSLLKIDKIETVERLGQVFHISVVGLKVPVPQRTDVRLTELPHIPVSRQTLDQSVTKLSKTALKGPDFSKGYADWRKAIAQGRAGVFTISVASIVGSVEESLKTNAPSPPAPRRSR
jgi:hypothetical protein